MLTQPSTPAKHGFGLIQHDDKLPGSHAGEQNGAKRKNRAETSKEQYQFKNQEQMKRLEGKMVQKC